MTRENNGRCFECHITCTIGPLLKSALHLRGSFTTQMREPILSDRQSRPELVIMRGENKPDILLENHRITVEEQGRELGN